MTAALARLCNAHPGQSGVQLLDDGPAALAVRIALVRRAREAIDCQYYIWRHDTAGRLLLAELVAAAARGVRVRLLLDDFGCPGFDGLALPGIEVRLFNPGRLRRWRWLNALFDFPRLNRRMHNKSLTVDGIATVIGGRNIGDEYFDDAHADLAVDLDVLAIGTIAAEVAADFQRYWDHAVPRPPGTAVLPVGEAARRMRWLAAADSPATHAMIDDARDFTWAQVRMLSDPPEKIAGAAAEARLLLPQLVGALGPVRRRLLLVSAYFVPTASGTSLLGGLVQQGVTVDVLTNSLLSNNVALVHAWYAPWRVRLLKAGVRLWEMRGVAGDRVSFGLVPRRLRRRRDATSFFRASASELHTKSFIADGRWLFVGSMNFDPRSWKLNTEMGFLIDSPALAGRLEAALDAGLPRFAWALELHEGQLAWRDNGHLLKPEPGTTALQRLVMRLLGRLPLAEYF
ncbi:phospholipase D family protein [Sandarakinorhabdus sp. AAP62]|uniref:phospholipase D family protein n=1 Tax=Sandarakinorhabdus sp. AAP62 TaxID=1248916 RepID=UPI0003122324|nr:phospholipase D family protein [Sandarakinorhabdus sp. AAP62]